MAAVNRYYFNDSGNLVALNDSGEPIRIRMDTGDGSTPVTEQLLYQMGYGRPEEAIAALNQQSENRGWENWTSDEQGTPPAILRPKGEDTATPVAPAPSTSPPPPPIGEGGGGISPPPPIPLPEIGPNEAGSPPPPPPPAGSDTPDILGGLAAIVAAGGAGAGGGGGDGGGGGEGGGGAEALSTTTATPQATDNGLSAANILSQLASPQQTAAASPLGILSPNVLTSQAPSDQAAQTSQPQAPLGALNLANQPYQAAQYNTGMPMAQAPNQVPLFTPMQMQFPAQTPQQMPPAGQMPQMMNMPQQSPLGQQTPFGLPSPFAPNQGGMAPSQDMAPQGGLAAPQMQPTVGSTNINQAAMLANQAAGAQERGTIPKAYFPPAGARRRSIAREMSDRSRQNAERIAYLTSLADQGLNPFTMQPYDKSSRVAMQLAKNAAQAGGPQMAEQQNPQQSSPIDPVGIVSSNIPNIMENAPKETETVKPSQITEDDALRPSYMGTVYAIQNGNDSYFAKNPERTKGLALMLSQNGYYDLANSINEGNLEPLKSKSVLSLLDAIAANQPGIGYRKNIPQIPPAPEQSTGPIHSEETPKVYFGPTGVPQLEKLTAPIVYEQNVSGGVTGTPYSDKGDKRKMVYYDPINKRFIGTPSAEGRLAAKKYNLDLSNVSMDAMRLAVGGFVRRKHG